jgi:hypothetical protein
MGSDAFYYLRGSWKVFSCFRPQKKTMRRRYHSIFFYKFTKIHLCARLYEYSWRLSCETAIECNKGKLRIKWNSSWIWSESSGTEDILFVYNWIDKRGEDILFVQHCQCLYNLQMWISRNLLRGVHPLDISCMPCSFQYHDRCAGSWSANIPLNFFSQGSVGSFLSQHWLPPMYD